MAALGVPGAVMPKLPSREDRMSRDPNDQRSFSRRVRDFTAGLDLRQKWNAFRNYRQEHKEAPVVSSVPRIVQI